MLCLRREDLHAMRNSECKMTVSTSQPKGFDAFAEAVLVHLCTEFDGEILAEKLVPEIKSQRHTQLVPRD